MKHVKPVLIHYDFNERRAILMEGSEDSRMTLTSIHGFTNMVASATEYEGQWPVVGGIRGDELSVKELIALGEKIRSSSPYSHRLWLHLLIFVELQLDHLASKKSSRKTSKPGL